MISTITDILWSLPITHIVGITTLIIGTVIGVYSRIG